MTRIAIVTCGPVDSNLALFHGQYSDMFVCALGKEEPNFIFENFDAYKGCLPDQQAFDGFLLTGSIYNAYDNDAWIHALICWIVECEQHKRPLVGVCFGHQIIARALGGRVSRSDKGWGLGSYQVDMMLTPVWLSDIPSHLKLYVSHQDQVTEVPDAFHVFAGSPFCPNFMLVKEHHVLTIQGHPEFTSSFVDSIVECLSETISPQVYQNGKNTLAAPVDSALVCQWIARFFRYSVARANTELR